MTLGLYSKLHAGPAEEWVNDSLGGVFYVVFWCLAILLALGRIEPRGVALVVVAVTSSLEFLQLWHPVALEAIRASFVGRALLGTTFSWNDFPYYFLGGGIGWLIVRMLLGIEESPGTANEPRQPT
jgi:hypothetical protein